MWDLTTRAKARDLPPHTTPINAVAVSADGQRMAVGSADGLVRIYHGTTGAVEREFDGKPGALLSLAFHPDGRLLVGAELMRLPPDGTAALATLDVATGRVVAHDNV